MNKAKKKEIAKTEAARKAASVNLKPADRDALKRAVDATKKQIKG